MASSHKMNQQIHHYRQMGQEKMSQITNPSAGLIGAAAAGQHHHQSNPTTINSYPAKGTYVYPIF